MKRWVIAYLRLSKEDGDDVESGSIINQRKIIQSWADTNGIIIDDFIVDDGYSGFTLDRPGFNKIKQLLNDGIKCMIIAKDLSRLGRHSAKVQLFIENATEIGSRVVTLVENCDTDIEESQEYVGIHAWINEKMVRDTSKKVRVSLHTTQEAGKILGNVPYGYIKDDKQKYTYYVDDIAAKHIKLIFDLYISGYGIGKVARALTEMNIPTPSMMKKIRAEQNGKQYKGKVSAIWESGVINKIIRNDFYIGTLTTNKTRRKTINGRAIKQPKEEMHVFPNAHPAIIDKATWLLAQSICDQRKELDYRGKKKSRKNIYAGLLICADCGKHLTSAGGVDGNTRYICRTYNTHGTTQCTSHAVSEQEISYVLIDFLEYCKNNLGRIIDDLNAIIEAEMQCNSNTTNNIDDLKLSLQHTKKGVEILIEQKMRETMKNPSMVDMIDKMYDDMLNEKYKTIQILEQQINELQQVAIDEVEMKNDLNNALALISSVIESKELTKKQVLLLVDKIVVHEDTSIDFYLKGNLHEICQGYFKVSGSKLAIIKRKMYEYIMDNQERFTAKYCTVYIRNSGTKLTLNTVAKIINEELVAHNIVKLGAHGYRLIGTQEELARLLIPNNVGDIHRRIGHDNVIKTISAISTWIRSLEYKKKIF